MSFSITISDYISWFTKRSPEVSVERQYQEESILISVCVIYPATIMERLRNSSLILNVTIM